MSEDKEEKNKSNPSQVEWIESSILVVDLFLY